MKLAHVNRGTEAEFVNRFIAGLKDTTVKYKVYEQLPVPVA